MNTLWPILGMTAGVYAIRLGGFLLGDVALPPGIELALSFVPVAMLAALCATTLAAGAGDLPIRLVAALGGGIVAHRTGKGWACILVGMLIYWTLGRL